MKHKFSLFLFNVLMISLFACGQENKENNRGYIVKAGDMAVTYPLALDPDADIFGLYALKEAGVIRNVVIDRSGKIIFLTRLYDQKEFQEMKAVIFSSLEKK